MLGAPRHDRAVRAIADPPEPAGVQCAMCPARGTGHGWVQLCGYPPHAWRAQNYCSPGCLAAGARQWAEQRATIPALRPPAAILPPSRRGESPG
jgi:hypothetical protein